MLLMYLDVHQWWMVHAFQVKHLFKRAAVRSAEMLAQSVEEKRAEACSSQQLKHSSESCSDIEGATVSMNKMQYTYTWIHNVLNVHD